MTELAIVRKDFPQYGATAWAVHDKKRATYLMVSSRDNHFLGVFGCEVAAHETSATEGCPWLGRCHTEAYGHRTGYALWDDARCGDFTDQYVYQLLIDLHLEAAL